MFSEERCHYAALVRQAEENQRRSRQPIDKTMLLLLCIIFIPGILFFVAIAMIFGQFPGLNYPGSNYEIHERNIHRAITYSYFPNSTKEYYEFFNYKPSKETKETPTTFKLVCYYNFPDNRRSLQIKDLDPFLCTHINLAFAKVRNCSIFLEETEKNILEQLVKLKERNVDLKVLMSVGGAGNDSGFSEMVLNHTNRKTFIQSVFEYKKRYQVDGIDLDWEFPNEHPDGDRKQKIHFTQLLEEFRHSIDRKENFTFLVTVAVPAPYFLAEKSYDIMYLNEYVDYINLMSYDYHFYTRTTPFTGHNSPLFAADSEQDYLGTLNINYSVHFWNYMGMNRKKIVVGLPTYGHSFKLLNPDNNGTYAPAIGYGKLGKSGFVCYPDVRLFLQRNYITPTFDMDAKSPYASILDEWVSFDNVQSLTFKSEFIKNHKLGGAMIYSLNCDDYNLKKMKTEKTFPLINTVKDILFES